MLCDMNGWGDKSHGLAVVGGAPRRRGCGDRCYLYQSLVHVFLATHSNYKLKCTYILECNTSVANNCSSSALSFMIIYYIYRKQIYCEFILYPLTSLRP